MTPNALPPNAFKLLWLWIHQARGASSTLAELQTLTRSSSHIIKQALMALASENLVTYNGLSDHSMATPSLSAYSVFLPADQPTDQALTISQPTGTRPSAGQPTVHDQPTDPEPAYMPETLQNSLQKNFFVPKKIFSPTQEEEDIKLIKLNNSSSSSQSGEPEKIFSAPELPADFDQRMTALANLAKLNSLRIRRELAELPWATPDYIERHACGFYHGEHRTVAEAGMLRRRIADHWPEPELCTPCHYAHFPPEPLPDDNEPLPPTTVPAEFTDPAWTFAMLEMQRESNSIYRKWLEPTRLQRVENGHYTITAPTPEHAAWLTDRLTTTLTRILEGCLNQTVQITFVPLVA